MLQTDRNTPSRFKIDFLLFKYNGFWVITDINRFFLILPVFDIFEDEIGGVRITIESQWGGEPNEVMKMSSVTNFGASGGHIYDVVAPELKKHVFTATAMLVGVNHGPNSWDTFFESALIG